MPAAGELPPALSALSHRNALEVRDERFDDDVARLGDSIRALGVADDSGPAGTGPTTSRVAVPLVGVALLLAAAGAYVALRPARTQPAQAVPAAAPAADLDGDWIAEMQKDGQRPVPDSTDLCGRRRQHYGDCPLSDGRRSHPGRSPHGKRADVSHVARAAVRVGARHHQVSGPGRKQRNQAHSDGRFRYRTRGRNTQDGSLIRLRHHHRPAWSCRHDDRLDGIAHPSRRCPHGVRASRHCH